MDTKCMILAVALSIVVIMVYQHFFMPKPQPRPQQQQTEAADGQVDQQTQTPESVSTETPGTGDSGQNPDIFSEPKPEVKEDVQEVKVEDMVADEFEKDITIETDLYTAVFTNKGAGMKSFVFKKYNDDEKNPMDLINAKVKEKFGQNEVYPFYLSPFEGSPIYLEINSKNFRYQGEENVNIIGMAGETKELLFEYADPEKMLKVTKRFIITNNSYLVKIRYDVVINGKPVDAPIIFGPDLENNVSQNRVMQSTLRIGAYDGEDVKEKVFNGVKTDMADDPDKSIGKAKGTLDGGFYWASYDTNYFTALFKTNRQHRQVKWGVIKKRAQEKDAKDKVYAYMRITHPESVYLGPKDEELLGELETSHGYPEANKVVDYGWGFIGAIAKLMLKGILLIQTVIPNVGWALVFFTIFIKVLLFPLTYTSSVSMGKMQTLQPKLKAIKKKYKNLKDPEQRKQMNVETMALYKQEKVNPAGGCLPLLLQMPILFAFFRLLPISINFRHEPWLLWITDLSIKDPFYVLPILMGVTQIIVSKMSPTSADGAQQKMMYIMPVVMVFLFMSYSSGLNLYWFISNLLQIGQQFIINKRVFSQEKAKERERRLLKRKKGGKK